jgi:hypothetical protein
VVLDLHVRVGINVFVQPTTITPPLAAPFTYFAGVTPVYVPLVWGGQDSTPSANQAAAFTSGVYVGLRVLAGLRWGGVALASVALLACFAFLLGVCSLLSAADGDGGGLLKEEEEEGALGWAAHNSRELGSYSRLSQGDEEVRGGASAATAS